MNASHEIRQVLASLEARSRLASSEVLVGNLLHDMKQFLNVIRFIAQDIRMDIRKNRFDVEQLPDNMAEIENSIDQLVTCFDKLRRFVGSNQYADHIEPSNPNHICMEVIKNIRAQNADVLISESYVENVPSLEIDPFFFQQAIWEIVDNAVWAATDGKSGKPQVQLESSLRDNHFVVTIQDNGSGIKDEMRDKLFEPFFTTRPDASGFGLPLSQKSIAKCSGNIQLVRSTSEGSRFEILVPCHA